MKRAETPPADKTATATITLVVEGPPDRLGHQIGALLHKLVDSWRAEWQAAGRPAAEIEAAAAKLTDDLRQQLAGRSRRITLNFPA